MVGLFPGDTRSRRARLTHANGTGIDYAYDTGFRLTDVNNVTDTGQLKYAYSYHDVENRLIQVLNLGGDSLAGACDSDLIFTTGGDAEWFGQTVEYSHDFDAAQSGAIGDSEETWMETTVYGPGRITFDYKLSAAAGDGLSFSVDGQVVFSYSGSIGWAEAGPLTVSGLGPHTLRWQYTKDGSGSSGDDCLWIDYVRWQSQSYNSTQLQSALDTDLEVYTGGDSTWNMCDWPLYHIYYGDSSARSGFLYSWRPDHRCSQMEVRTEGPGTVTFHWKVSSEQSYDWLEFYIDGVRRDRISGDVDWQEKSYEVTGAGTHSLMWQYLKDDTDEAGSDCGWVDYLQWTPSAGGGGSSTTDWEQITYTYDPSGRRIAKDVDGEVTKYVYDGDHCIAEYDGDDTLLRKYIHGPCIDEPICMIEVADANAAYFYHYDGLGSVVALSDASGDTVQVYEYDVYGQIAASDPNHTNPFLFTGRRFDTETGLYYYRARYYNPSIGRFLQTDPIGYADGINWYTYCGNSALNRVDPLGLDWTFGTGPNDLQGYYWDGERNLLLQLTGTYNFHGVAGEMETDPAKIHIHYIWDPCDPCDSSKLIGVLFYFEGPHEFWEISDDWDPEAGDRAFMDVAEVELASQHGVGRHRHEWLKDALTEDLQAMYEAARAEGKYAKANKIKEEQKARGARGSRHSGDTKKIIYTTGGVIGEALREAWEDPSLANLALAGGIVIGGTVLVIGGIAAGTVGFGGS